jgi:hypothetical protein
LEGAGEEIEVGEEGFAGVEAGAGVVAGGVVDQIEQDLLVGGTGQPGVGTGIVLPESAPVANLPAFDGLRGLLVASVWGLVVLESPAADAGAVGLEAQAAVEFAGGGAVGGGRLGGQEFGEQGGDWGGPVRMMIAAGTAGRPSVGLTVGTGVEVVAIEFVEAGTPQAQFGGGRARRKSLGAMLG